MNSPKPFLALLHGWGMNAGVFDPVAACLSASFDVHAFNLPGHGGRVPLPENSLAAWAADLAAQLPDAASVLGWSLGGQVALRAALDHPQRVARLVLLSSTPRFLAAPDWPHGLPAAELDQFAEALMAQPHATLLRFLTLQTRGVAGQKALLADLRASLAAHPAPHTAALAAGLALLRGTDLRAALPQLRQPVLVIHGGLDTLTPHAAGDWLAAQTAGARLVTLPRAGHAPHLSHPDAVTDALRAFCHA